MVWVATGVGLGYGFAIMLVDSHCHLDFPDFAAERSDIITRARTAGVGCMLSLDAVDRASRSTHRAHRAGASKGSAKY